MTLKTADEYTASIEALTLEARILGQAATASPTSTGNES
jgi:hypothetical protein